MGEPILIWGAGAIGGTIGAYWARAGVDVLMVDIVADHAVACSTSGLTIEGPVDAFKQVVPTVTPDQVEGRFSRIILAVKALHTEAALEQLTPHLTDDGFILSAQNGLNEIAIADVVGEARTMGCFVNFGADWLGPGQILYGNRGTVVVGELDGQVRDRTREIHALLQIFEPDAILSTDVWAYLWGKLGYGAMLFATALTEESMHENFADPTRTEIWITLAREVMAVACARKVTPKGFNGYDPAAFAPGGSEADARESIAGLAEFNRTSAKTHSGVWRDLAVRKRATEVDSQVGRVADLAAEAGIDTPALRRLVELIHDVEQGRRTQSAETLDALRQACG